METLDVALKVANDEIRPHDCARRSTVITETDILNSSILIVDDQEANVALLEAIAA